ncbi:MAG: RNA polymerase sigma factor [Clostridia bacterium]|nr:RNA polymerase sigma factor [Clostridia bacterium]
MNDAIHNYTEYLFALALQKCGNLHDAEDLVGDTLLAAYQYLDKGGEIRNLKYWLTATLSHKWNDTLRRKYKLPFVSIDACGDIFENAVEEEKADTPHAQDVRREVAYLAKTYRDVIVLHYLQGMKTEDIAKKLGVPKGTVLSRLSTGRAQMRKGLEYMEQYEQQSFAPERLDINCHGSSGFHDEPWSLVANDKMKQNILIVAYEIPRTVVEIAKALGIPTAYVEPAVNDLVESELMAKVGHKVFTDFMITTPEQLLQGLDAQIELVEFKYEDLRAFVQEYLQALNALPFTANFAEHIRKKFVYYFVIHLMSHAIYTAVQRIVPSEETYPVRPDGGRWIATGSRYPEDFDFDTYRFGKYCYGGERWTQFENYLGATSVGLKVYDTQPNLNLYNRGPVGLGDEEVTQLLYMLYRDIPMEQTGFNPLYCEDIPHLIRCGVLAKDGENVRVDIPVITPAEYKAAETIRLQYMTALADMLEPWLREVFPKLKIEIPEHLEGRVAEFRRYNCYAIPMAFVKKAIAAGDFDTTNATPPMVLVVDDK